MAPPPLNDRRALLQNYGAAHDGGVDVEEDPLPSPQRQRLRSLSDASLQLAESIRLTIDHTVENFVERSFVLQGEVCSVRNLGGTATVLSEVITMTKNIVGAGVLSLSGGMAIYTDEPLSGCVTATLWIAILGAVFGYFCLLIAKVCKITKSATYRECWEDTMGRNGAMFVSLVTAIKPALANLAYSVILSQTLSSLLAGIGCNVGYTQCLLLTTIVFIFPLCMLKNLSVLAPASVLGTAGIILTAITMTIRYVDGSYTPGGQYYDHLPPHLRPDFGTRTSPLSLKILPFLCMVFEAYVMHYNSPRFFTELIRPTIPRFAKAVTGSFGLSAVLYAVMACVGFLTFGGHSNGYILNNYSPNDPLATVGRLAIAFSTLLTYPIVFVGTRDGVLDFLNVPMERQTANNLNALTVILLALITVLAIVFRDLGMLNAVGGGSLATIVVFVFPALMYRSAVQNRLKERATNGERLEVHVAMTLMVFGTVLGLIGAVQSMMDSTDSSS